MLTSESLLTQPSEGEYQILLPQARLFRSIFPASFTPRFLPCQTCSLQDQDSRALAPQVTTWMSNTSLLTTILLPALPLYVAQSMCLAAFQNSNVKRRHGKSHKNPLNADPRPVLLCL